jgi:hypothetical protein
MAAILREHVFGATFGPAREQLVQLVLDTIDLQRDLLLYGKIDGKLPSTVPPPIVSCRVSRADVARRPDKRW